jgi:dTDP-4-dehydrorhamnose 3,5-epimerase
MKFVTTGIEGAFVIEPELIEDERGFFSRTWCRREFTEHGLNPDLVQCNISFNRKKGTVRGMHYQAHPNGEAKIVRCTMGAIHDVIVDLRPGSKTYMKWIAQELTADNRNMLYVPEEVAHGFQTLVDNTEVFYQMSVYYVPDAARGVRWDDPRFKIAWPEALTSISERDRNYDDFVQEHRRNEKG